METKIMKVFNQNLSHGHIAIKRGTPFEEIADRYFPVENVDKERKARNEKERKILEKFLIDKKDYQKILLAEQHKESGKAGVSAAYSGPTKKVKVLNTNLLDGHKVYKKGTPIEEVQIAVEKQYIEEILVPDPDAAQDNELSEMTVKELREKAKDLGIEGSDKMKKDELIDVLSNAGE